MNENRRFFTLLIRADFWSPSRAILQTTSANPVSENCFKWRMVSRGQSFLFCEGPLTIRYPSRDWESPLRFSSVPSGQLVHRSIIEFRSKGILFSSSSVICQTTGPKPLPKRFLHIVRSRASSFNWHYPLLSLRSSSRFLRLLPRLLVTSIHHFIFPFLQ